MYTLLIVDDEPIIADSLREYLEEINQFDLDIYCAYSGEEALKYLDKIKIDIVLSDIVMPGINGLELQEKILCKWPRCKVIFLTGYSDFEYAKRALKNKGVGYILKTEDDEEIIKSIQKAIMQIEAEQMNEEMIKNAKHQMEMAMPLLQRDFFLHMIYGLECPDDVRCKKFHELKIPLDPEKPVLILIGRIDRLKDVSYWHVETTLAFEFQSVIDAYLSCRVNLVTVPVDPTKILCFIQPKENNLSSNAKSEWEQVLVFTRETLNSIQITWNKLLGTTCSFIIADEECNWKDVGTKYELLDFILNSVYGFGDEVILTENHFKNFCNTQKENNNTLEEVHIFRSRMRKEISLLETYLEAGSETKFFKLMNEVMNEIIMEMRNSNSASYGIVIELYYSFLLMFLTYINKVGIEQQIHNKVNLYKLVKMDACDSLEEIKKQFNILAQYIFEQKKNNQVNSNSKIIACIHEYIDNNMDGDLSLTNLAQIVHLNPSYLSRLYKQLTGVKLTDYINQVKIKKAKDLLKRSDVKIFEIASKLGYDTPAHFTRFFKKMTGITPQEYRKALSKGI